MHPEGCLITQVVTHGVPGRGRALLLLYLVLQLGYTALQGHVLGLRNRDETLVDLARGT